ncbi:hypothetical protein EV356DRAFT_537227 [Viridothelium virens]|uniref:Uncharacterized protein n=1 Tax=Viridothelium virens TaxID=1048519 RepID=A0A6A6GUZ9_VIRVR|nr:hypothetical protein EV356DRAFT_537227 [Viridothelium virens]
MSHSEDVCNHCRACARRSDWDFLREFFVREENFNGYARGLESKIAAELLNNLYLTEQNAKLHHDMNQLVAKNVGFVAETRQLRTNLHSAHSDAMFERQRREELEAQLEHAHTTTERVGTMLSRVIGVEEQDGVLDVSQLILENESLRQQLLKSICEDCQGRKKYQILRRISSAPELSQISN